MDHGANIELRSGLGYTPLHVTAHYDRVGVARLLLESGVRPDEEDFQVINSPKAFGEFIGSLYQFWLELFPISDLGVFSPLNFCSFFLLPLF